MHAAFESLGRKKDVSGNPQKRHALNTRENFAENPKLIISIVASTYTRDAGGR